MPKAELIQTAQQRGRGTEDMDRDQMRHPDVGHVDDGVGDAAQPPGSAEYDLDECFVVRSAYGLQRLRRLAIASRFERDRETYRGTAPRRPLRPGQLKNLRRSMRQILAAIVTHMALVSIFV